MRNYEKNMFKASKILYWTFFNSYNFNKIITFWILRIVKDLLSFPGYAFSIILI